MIRTFAAALGEADDQQPLSHRMSDDDLTRLVCRVVRVVCHSKSTLSGAYHANATLSLLTNRLRVSGLRRGARPPASRPRWNASSRRSLRSRAFAMPDYNRPPWTPTRRRRAQARAFRGPACSPRSATGAAWSRRSSPSTARRGASTSYISSTPTITRRPRSASCGSSSRVAICWNRTPCRTRRTPAVRCRQTTSTRCCGRRAGRRYRPTSTPGTTTGALGESRSRARSTAAYASRATSSYRS